MVVPTPPPITAEELAALRAEVESLRAQVADLTRQRDRHVLELTEILQTWMPIPPSEAEILAAVPNGEVLTKLIADLEAR